MQPLPNDEPDLVSEPKPDANEPKPTLTQLVKSDASDSDNNLDSHIEGNDPQSILIQNTVESARKSLLPIDNLTNSIRALMGTGRELIGTFKNERNTPNIQGVAFPRKAIASALDRFTNSLDGLPEDKRREVEMFTNNLSSFLPFEVRSNDGRAIIVNGFNTEEEWNSLEGMMGAINNRAREIVHEWYDMESDRLVDALWSNPDMDQYAKMVLQWGIEKNTFYDADRVVQMAKRIEKFDTLLKQHPGEVVWLSPHFRSGEVDTVFKTDGSGVTIKESEDLEDPFRDLILGGRAVTFTRHGDQTVLTVADAKTLSNDEGMSLFESGEKDWTKEGGWKEDETELSSINIRIGAMEEMEGDIAMSSLKNMRSNPWGVAKLGIMLEYLGVNPEELFKDVDPEVASIFKDDRDVNKEKDEIRKSIEDTKKRSEG